VVWGHAAPPQLVLYLKNLTNAILAAIILGWHSNVSSYSCPPPKKKVLCIQKFPYHPKRVWLSAWFRQVKLRPHSTLATVVAELGKLAVWTGLKKLSNSKLDWKLNSMKFETHCVTTWPWASPCRRDTVETWTPARTDLRAFPGHPDTADQSACRESRSTLPGWRPAFNTRWRGHARSLCSSK